VLYPVAVGAVVQEGVLGWVVVRVVLTKYVFDIEDIVVLVDKCGVAISGESDDGAEGEWLGGRVGRKLLCLGPGGPGAGEDECGARGELVVGVEKGCADDGGIAVRGESEGDAEEGEAINDGTGVAPNLRGRIKDGLFGPG